MGYGRAFHGSFATVYTDAEMSFYFKSSFFASIHVTRKNLKTLAGKLQKQKQKQHLSN